MQSASDESYRDPTNLQSKLQKHQAFEAELSANKGRVDSVGQVKHYNSEISTHDNFGKQKQSCPIIQCRFVYLFIYFFSWMVFAICMLKKYTLLVHNNYAVMSFFRLEKTSLMAITMQLTR